jgi:hypothetical protein
MFFDWSIITADQGCTFGVINNLSKNMSIGTKDSKPGNATGATDFGTNTVMPFGS